jgi:hypothetical protein
MILVSTTWDGLNSNYQMAYDPSVHNLGRAQNQLSNGMVHDPRVHNLGRAQNQLSNGLWSLCPQRGTGSKTNYQMVYDPSVQNQSLKQHCNIPSQENT